VNGAVVGVPEEVGEPLAGLSAVPARHRRAIAVATDAMELLRPESDLARLLETFEHADVLLAAEQVPMEDGDEDDEAEGAWPGVGGTDEVRSRAADLDHPDLVVHRLGLRAPVAAAAEADVVAGLSELVGFDPEAGVYCLAPAAPLPGASSPDDPGRRTVAAAARRIARVYGLPLLSYRCLELSVVEDPPST
jgi:hypothetical protein